LAEETGLSERSVCTHLDKAAKAGWLEKGRKGLKGRSWMRSEYTAVIPEKVLKEVQYRIAGGTERGSAHQQLKGTESHSDKALKKVQSSTTYKNSSNIPPNPPGGSRHTPPDAAFKLAYLLLELIRERLPDFKQPNLDRWAKDLNRAICLDYRTPQQLEAVIRWAQADDFWCGNILSGAKVRQKFDQLSMKMAAQQKNALDRRPQLRPATYMQQAAMDTVAILERIKHAEREAMQSHSGKGNGQNESNLLPDQTGQGIGGHG
jgi:hypothetical protein